MSGESYCTVCDTVGTFGTEHKGCVYRTTLGTMPIEVQGRFVAGVAESLLDYAGDFEAGESLLAEFGMASDWDEPFAPEPLPFRTAGWQDAAECTTCKAIGLYGIVHLGCGGMFTIIYE